MAVPAVLFDLDDTLVVEEAAAEAALAAVCRRAGERYGLAPAAFQRSVRGRARDLWHASPGRAFCLAIGMSSWEGLWARFEGHGPELQTLRAWAPVYRREAWAGALAEHGVSDAAFARQLADGFMDERRARHAAFPDAAACLSALRGKVPLTIVTNGATDLQWEKIRGAGLDGFFDRVVTSGELGLGKPDKRIFQAALADGQAGPGRAVMVGNSLNKDVAGAQRAGLVGVWLNRNNEPPRPGVHPDAQIASLAQLPALVERLGLGVTTA